MKVVTDFAIKLENKPGALSEVSDLLGSNGINILALTVRTEGETGILNFVSTDPVRAAGILQGAGYSVTTNEILAAEAPHHPGGLNAILKPLRLAGVNVDYVYSCIGQHGAGDATIVLLGVDKLQAAHDALSREWIRLYGEELYNF